MVQHDEYVLALKRSLLFLFSFLLPPGPAFLIYLFFLWRALLSGPTVATATGTKFSCSLRIPP